MVWLKEGILLIYAACKQRGAHSFVKMPPTTQNNWLYRHMSINVGNSSVSMPNKRSQQSRPWYEGSIRHPNKFCKITAAPVKDLLLQS